MYARKKRTIKRKRNEMGKKGQLNIDEYWLKKKILKNKLKNQTERKGNTEVKIKKK